MQQQGSILKSSYHNRLMSFCTISILLTILAMSLSAQVNYVPNPGFEEVSDCDIEFGEIDKAQPWKIINAPIATPDLYHSCSNIVFFNLPAGACDPVYPKSGEGMAGLVTNHGMAEERIYTRLTDELPQGIDIYVAYSVRPRKKCDVPFEYACYSNTQSLVFSDFQFQSRRVVLESDTIIYAAEEWTKMETCYTADGTEVLILLGNYKTATQTLQDCDYINPANYTYFFVDEVVVSPFDVVPDTVFLCEDEVLNMDVIFFDVPISWSDGWNGGQRAIVEEGTYTVFGEVENCWLADSMVVIIILDEMVTAELSICEGEELILEAPIQAIWENGDTSTVLVVNRPGHYIAQLLSTCGNLFREYHVEDRDCAIIYHVPNAFSPNGDGINDEFAIFFESDFDFSGELYIFDRWGNMLFKAENDNAIASISWDGYFKGKPLNSSVVVWIYRYLSAKDGKTRTISGDITILTSH